MTSVFLLRLTFTQINSWSYSGQAPAVQKKKHTLNKRMQGVNNLLVLPYQETRDYRH